MKPAFLLTAVLALLAAGASAGSRTRLDIHTEIAIAAPAEAIWDVLADTANYPAWNPYHVRVEGPAERGAKLTVEIHKPNGKQLVIRPRVMKAVPGKTLVWGGGIRGIFHGTHRFDLEEISSGCTRLTHSEVFSGLFISFAELGAIEPGYRQMNEALKARLEGPASRSCG